MRKLSTIIFLLILSAVCFGQFDPKWEKIPSTFNGTLFNSVWYGFLSKSEWIEKDEFETTADFEKRIKTFKGLEFKDGVNPQNDLAFVYRSAKSATSLYVINYDADKQKLHIRLPLSIQTSYKKLEKSEYQSIEILPRELKDDGVYVGENTYGNKRTVNKFIFTSFYFGVSNISDLIQSKYDDAIVLKLNLEAVKAKSLKENFGVIFLTHLEYPFFTIGGKDLKPTIESPRDVKVFDKTLIGILKDFWIFDAKTGEVFYKFAQPEYKSDIRTDKEIQILN